MKTGKSISEGFRGFRPETVDFLRRLSANNDKDWFQKHKDEFKAYVERPSKDFAAMMAVTLPHLVPGRQFTGKVFRIYRDLRFTKDKRPYKTNIGIRFVPTPRLGRESENMFYFHLEPDCLLLAGGIYRASAELLEKYRRSVDARSSGTKLAQVVRELERNGGSLGGQRLKRVPANFSSEHPRAELLKWKSLYAYEKTPLPRQLFGSSLVPYCLEGFRKFIFLWQWLDEL